MGQTSQRHSDKETMKDLGISVGKSIQRDMTKGKPRAQKAQAGHDKDQLQRYSAPRTVTGRGGMETDRSMMPTTGFPDVQVEGDACGRDLSRGCLRRKGVREQDRRQENGERGCGFSWSLGRQPLASASLT